MKPFFNSVIVLIFLFPLASYAQSGSNPANNHLLDWSGLSLNGKRQQMYIYNLTPKHEVKGSEYWDEDWKDGIIMLRNGDTLYNIPILIDVYNWALDVKTDEDIKVLPGAMVRDFYLGKANKDGAIDVSHHFVNPRGYFNQLRNFESFFELIEEGKISLMVQHIAKLQEPSYVPILDAGEPDYSIVKKEKTFLFDGEEMLELPKGKKKVVGLLSNYHPKVSSFAKETKLGVKKMDELASLVRYCNGDTK